MSNTSDQTTQQSKTRLIVGEIGVDTETGIIGKGHSYDNGKTFVVDDTIYGRIYHADDHGKIWKGIQDQVAKVVEPAKSAANSAVSYANDAIENSKVNSQAIDDINSAVSDAVSDAAVARSDGLRAWNAAQSNVNLIDLNYASASASISSARTEALAAADEAKKSASAAQADIVVVKSDVAAVQADVTATRSDVAVAKSDIADTKTSLSSQATSLSSYAAQASAAGNDITTLKSQAGQFEQDIASTKGDVSQLKVSASSASVALSDAAGNISSLQATATSYSAALSDTNSNVASVTATASELETKYADAAGDISTLQADAKGMTQTISDAQGDIAKLKTRADGFDAEFATANGNINKLQTDATGTTQTLTNAKSDIAVLQSRADGFDAKYATAAGDINTLKANASGFSQTLTNAQGDISTLKSTVSGVQTTLTNAQGNISTLQSDVSGLKKTTSDNAGNISTLQSTANTLTSQMSSAQGDISTLKQTASGISSQVSGMATSLSNANSKINSITSNGGGRNLAIGTDQKYAMGYGIPNTVWQDGYAYEKLPTTIIDIEILPQDPHTFYYTLTQGTTYTQTIWFETDATVKDLSAVQITWYTNGVGHDFQSATLINLGENKYKIYSTHTWPGKSDNSVRLFDIYYLNSAFDLSTGTYLKFGKLELENGTISHDWSPAPEDDDAKITANTTAIEQNKQAIALKADQTTVDKTNGTVQRLQSQLKVQADQIASKVSSSDLDARGYATQDYTQSLVTQKANDWNLNLTNLKTDVNAIKTNGGGRNLVANTGTDIVIDATSSNASNWTWATIYFNEQPKLGDSITVSAESTLTGTGTLDEYQVVLYDASCTNARSTAQYLKAGIRDSVTLSLDNLNGTGDTVLLIYAGKAGETQGKKNVIHHLMVEKGMVAHDWSPAPSDMATVTSVTNLSAKVGGIQAQVYNSDGSSRITQLSNLIATKVSSDDYTSQITQLKNDINLRVTKGDVVSQINEEAGGNTLIQVSNGNGSLVLDAKTTVFTGDAFIPSAAISSISADKIMLGSSALWNTDGTLNLVNQSNGLKALMQVKQGLVQNTTQSIISFASDYNTRAFSITPVGATVTPTLFFERYDQAPDHWLGFSRNEVEREGLEFNTWDNEGERFFVDCHARFHKNLSTEGIIYQGSWDGTTGKPLAGILSIQSGNTIWSGSGYLAIGDHLSNSFTDVKAKSFSQQSTLSSKTNIETVDPKDALDLVNQTDIRSYQYKSDVEQGKTKRYTSLIIDDVNDVSQYHAPDEFVNEDRTGRDDGSAVGYLFLAVKELTRRIKNLEEKLNG